MEYNERYNHSAMIAELLDPKGSHHMEKFFLREFLNIIVLEGSEMSLSSKPLNIDEFLENDVTVMTEYNTGPVNFDTRKGGYIDILIKSGSAYLSIENKIHARDQQFQLERYKNLDSKNSIVFYLTLDGKQSPESTSDESPFDDYHCISYQDHILRWLERCLQLSYNKPILRESIRQYFLNVKKITNQLEPALMPELRNLIKTHLKEAEQIHLNFENVTNNIKLELITYLENELKKRLSNYNINSFKEGKDLGLSIYTENGKEEHLYFGVFNFKDGAVRCGVKNEYGPDMAVQLNKYYESENDNDEHFPISIYLRDRENTKLNMGSIDTLSKIADTSYRDQVVQRNVEAIVEFVNKYKDLVEKHNTELQEKSIKP